jgi:hypothetical protein
VNVLHSSEKSERRKVSFKLKYSFDPHQRAVFTDMSSFGPDWMNPGTQPQPPKPPTRNSLARVCVRPFPRPLIGSCLAGAPIGRHGGAGLGWGRQFALGRRTNGKRRMAGPDGHGTTRLFVINARQEAAAESRYSQRRRETQSPNEI